MAKCLRLAGALLVAALFMTLLGASPASAGAVPGSAVRARVTLQFIVCHQGLYTGAAHPRVPARTRR